MKYWLMAVSSADRTSCRTFRISGSPFTRTSQTADAGHLIPSRRPSYHSAHERERSPGAGVGRGRPQALGRESREGVREDAPLEEGLDDGLGRAGRAARGARLAARVRLRAGPRLAGGVPVHPRRPGDRLSRQALDDAPVRRLRHGETDERALPLPPRARADRTLDGVPPSDALRLRLRPPHVARRGRQVRRRDRLARATWKSSSTASTSGA